MVVRSAFDVLGVSKTTTDDEIKAAYKKLARKWHPDKNPNRLKEAEEKFKEIQTAYDSVKERGDRDRYIREHTATERKPAAEKKPTAEPSKTAKKTSSKTEGFNTFKKTKPSTDNKTGGKTFFNMEFPGFKDGFFAFSDMDDENFKASTSSFQKPKERPPWNDEPDPDREPKFCCAYCRKKFTIVELKQHQIVCRELKDVYPPSQTFSDMPAPKPTGDWRQTHEHLIDGIRRAKQLYRGQAPSPTIIQCSRCKESFSSETFFIHVNMCRGAAPPSSYKGQYSSQQTDRTRSKAPPGKTRDGPSSNPATSNASSRQNYTFSTSGQTDSRPSRSQYPGQQTNQTRSKGKTSNGPSSNPTMSNTASRHEFTFSTSRQTDYKSSKRPFGPLYKGSTKETTQQSPAPKSSATKFNGSSHRKTTNGSDWRREPYKPNVRPYQPGDAR